MLVVQISTVPGGQGCVPAGPTATTLILPAGSRRLGPAGARIETRSSNGTVPTSTAQAEPSTGITAPFTYDAASDSSQVTTAATSSAVAARRCGTSDVTRS